MAPEDRPRGREPVAPSHRPCRASWPCRAAGCGAGGPRGPRERGGAWATAQNSGAGPSVMRAARARRRGVEGGARAPRAAPASSCRPAWRTNAPTRRPRRRGPRRWRQTPAVPPAARAAATVVHAAPARVHGRRLERLERSQVRTRYQSSQACAAPAQGASATACTAEPTKPSGGAAARAAWKGRWACAYAARSAVGRVGRGPVPEDVGEHRDPQGQARAVSAASPSTRSPGARRTGRGRRPPPRRTRSAASRRARGREGTGALGAGFHTTASGKPADSMRVRRAPSTRVSSGGAST
jgi:hypothetical protein